MNNEPHEIAPPTDYPAGVHVRERLLICVIALGGGCLRLGGLEQQLALSHFDEGVYVLWAMGLEYPGRISFAPPLFPWIVQGTFWLLGPGAVQAIAVNCLFGTVTVPLVWWVARRWYGPAAAVCAATLAACSDYHIAFSRMALTDITFTFWFILTLWFASEVFLSCREHAHRSDPSGAQPRGSLGAVPLRAWIWVALGGLSAGAALNTKYNGVLVLLLPLMAGGWLLVIQKGFRDLGSIGRRVPHSARSQSPFPYSSFQWHLATGIGLWIVASLIGIVLYLPWALHVSRQMGYGSLLEHQRGYTVGLGSWPGNLLTMLLDHRYLTLWTGRLAPGLGLLAALLVCSTIGTKPGFFGKTAFRAMRKFPERARETSILVSSRAQTGVFSRAIAKFSMLGGAVALGLTIGDAVGWVLGLAGIVLLRPPSAPVAAIHGTWLAGLLLLTPLYQPYPRLMMPLVAAGWIGAGALVAGLLRRLDQEQPTGKESILWSGTCLALVVIALVVGRRFPTPQPPIASPNSLREACGRIARALPIDQPTVAFVRPPVLFYLGGQRRLSLAENLTASRASPGQYLLIDSAMLKDNPSAAAWLETSRAGLTELAREPYQVSPIVLLNDFGRPSETPPDHYFLVLYRLSLSGSKTDPGSFGVPRN